VSDEQNKNIGEQINDDEENSIDEVNDQENINNPNEVSDIDSTVSELRRSGRETNNPMNVGSMRGQSYLNASKIKKSDKLTKHEDRKVTFRDTKVKRGTDIEHMHNLATQSIEKRRKLNTIKEKVS